MSRFREYKYIYKDGDCHLVFKEARPYFYYFALVSGREFCEYYV